MEVESYADFYSSYGDVVWHADSSYDPDGNGVSVGDSLVSMWNTWNGGTESESNSYGGVFIWVFI